MYIWICWGFILQDLLEVQNRSFSWLKIWTYSKENMSLRLYGKILLLVYCESLTDDNTNVVPSLNGLVTFLETFLPHTGYNQSVVNKYSINVCHNKYPSVKGQGYQFNLKHKTSLFKSSDRLAEFLQHLRANQEAVQW